MIISSEGTSSNSDPAVESEILEVPGARHPATVRGSGPTPVPAERLGVDPVFLVGGHTGSATDLGRFGAELAETLGWTALPWSAS
ncbi:MAG TPA: hypothetical protein VK020_02550 [Microlunatus sp.]|nr:hypothetical protein [Microlunatus sp.]